MADINGGDNNIHGNGSSTFESWSLINESEVIVKGREREPRLLQKDLDDGGLEVGSKGFKGIQRQRWLPHGLTGHAAWWHTVIDAPPLGRTQTHHINRVKTAKDPLGK